MEKKYLIKLLQLPLEKNQKVKLMVPSIGALPVTTTYSDYRNINGVRLPFKTLIESRSNGKIDIEYETLKVHQQFKASDFQLIDHNKKAL